MPTIRFTLIWPDGATVTATATAAHPNDEAAISYTGARERLPVAPERCAVSTLREVFTRGAVATPGAHLDESQSVPWPEEDGVSLGPEHAPRLGIRVLERLEDYTLDRLAVVDGPGGPELHGWFEGVECLLDAKPGMLAAGFVACIPLDPEIGLDWPMQIRAEIDGISQLCDNVTAEPRAVAALMRLAREKKRGGAHSGMMIVS